MIKKSVLLLFLVIFTSCKPGSSEKEPVMFLHYFTGNLSQGINELSKEVNKKAKNINIIATPLEHEEFKTDLRLQLDGQNTPDLFSYWAGARTQYLVDNDKVAPISPLFNNQIDPTFFDESVLNACSYNGEIFLLPLTRHFIGFFYNKEIFRQLHIEIPENWEELVSAAQLLQESGVIPFSLGSKNRWPAQFWFDYILLRTAGFDYRLDLMKKHARYTDLEVLKTMDFWQELIEKQYFNKGNRNLTWDNAIDLLIEGQAAMSLMGTWAIPYLEQQGFNQKNDYGFFQFPLIDSEIENVALGPIDGILLSKKSTHVENSYKILSILAQSDIQKAFNIQSGAIAPHIGIKDSAYSPIQQEIKGLIEKIPYWAFNYDLATEPYVSEAGLDFFVEFMENPENYEFELQTLQEKINQQ